MINKNTAEHPTPPYLPLKTFLNLLGKLKKTAVPPIMDSSVTQNFSGGMRGALTSALNFFSLIEKNGKVNSSLKLLVDAYESEQWKNAFEQIITNAYARIITDLDIKTATSGQLEEKFKTNGKLSGQMAEKAIRFYLAALNETGSVISPHFKSRSLRQNANKKINKGSNKNKQEKSEDSKIDPRIVRQPGEFPGMDKITVPLPGIPDGFILFPSVMSQDKVRVKQAIKMADIILKNYYGVDETNSVNFLESNLPSSSCKNDG